MTTPADRAAELLRELERLGSAKNVEGMARYGIRPAKALGVPGPALMAKAKSVGRDHELAAALWDTGVLEARMLGALVEEPSKVTRTQMEGWAKTFDSWAICDGVCMHLFDRTPYAWEKARAWSRRRGEYVKRAGFALMAVLAVHDKKAPNEAFVEFLEAIEREADDERNYVKKAVNWALRQIGKRSMTLNAAAVGSCLRLRERDSRAARWIASDALRELTNQKVRARIRRP